MNESGFAIGEIGAGKLYIGNLSLRQKQQSKTWPVNGLGYSDRDAICTETENALQLTHYFQNGKPFNRQWIAVSISLSGWRFSCLFQKA
jgi:hypothetical protein